MRTLLKTLLLLLAPWGLSAGAPLPGDELPTVEELRGHLKKWHADVVVFQIRYKNTWPDSDIVSYREFLMTDTKEYLDTEEWFGLEESPSKSINGGNENTRFYTKYAWNAETKDWELKSVMAMDRLTSNVGASVIVKPFYLMLDSQRGEWAADRLLKNDVTIQGEEIVDGERCIKVEVILTEEKGRAGMQIWFAPEKDYLIKKILPIREKGASYRAAEYLCEDFRFDGTRWYPFRGQIGLPPDNSFWEVEQLVINPRVRPSMFIAPPHPKRTRDHPDHAHQTGLQSQSNENLTGPPLPEALPSTTNYTLLFGGLAGLSFLAAIGWWRMNQRR
jgi:hypothetical protein